MRTDTENVCFLGKTGSDRCTLEMTRMRPISDIGIGLEPSGGRALQVIGTPAARLELIAEQFPMVPAAISLHRVGLIRRGCSLRANCLELGLLLVAQRSIEIVKC
jgi:hypothetical protein